ncbi:MAG: hypothetical protein Fur006_40510 [Coleofasciculaceae cyanobacterium]
MLWDAFLKKAADDHGLFECDERKAFLEKLTKRERQKSDAEVAANLGISEPTLKRQLKKVYQLFTRSCPALDVDTRTKFRILRDWLNTGYVRYEETGELPWQPTTSNLGVSTSASTITTQQQGMLEDYVEPANINFCYNEILMPGCLLRIKAPWKMGKTELMSRIVQYAESQGYRKAILKLRDAMTTDFNDLNQFLKWFCTSIAQELALINLVDEHWNKSIGNPKNKCKTYFEKYLLPGESPLVLALDDVDRVFPYQEIAREFLGMLRTRHEDAKTRPVWGKLCQLLVYTEDYREIDINQSPFNVGILIELPELSQEQVQELAQQYGLNWDANQVNQLIDMVGGHPYLVKQAIKYMTQPNITLDELLEKAPTQAGIYSEYLQKYWQKLRKYQELTTAFSKVVMADSPVELHPDLADKLNNLGLVRFKSNSVIPRYELYRQYFRFCLGSSR